MAAAADTDGSAARAAETHPRRSIVAPACVLVFSSIVLALHLVSARDWTSALWGVHSWAFFPAAAGLAALALTVLAAVPLATWAFAAARDRGQADHSAGEVERAANGPASPGPEPRGNSPGVGAIVLGSMGALIGAVLLWVVRARSNLLGDGVAIVAGVHAGGRLHELEPLTVLIQARVFDVLRALPGPAHTPREMTWNTVALVSVVAGALFVPAAWGLAREIESDGGPAATPIAAGSRSRWTLPLVFAILIAQGYLQLFCGYVENYAPVALANALVLLAGLRYARGRGSLFAVGAAALFAIALHLSASALMPACGALALWGVLRGPNRRRAMIDVGLIVLLGAILTLALAGLEPGYLLPRTLWDVAVRAVGQRQEDPTYLLSPRHLRDVLNEQALIGPLGIFCFAAGLVVALTRGTWRRPDMAFVAIAGLGYAASCVVAGDSNLGYARNWDLLAPAGVVFTVAGLRLARPAFRPAGLWPRALLLAAALSVFHTLPWIALNASEPRSVERFATLPLGRGRTENTIAFWYAERGNFAEAKRWVQRSLAANPDNSRAMDLYGRIAFEEHNPRLALRTYLVAVTIRPDKPEYRQQLATAVAMSGGPTVGLRQLDTLIVGHEDNGGLWLERSMLLRASGRAAESVAAREHALRLWPGLASTADSLPFLASE